MPSLPATASHSARRAAYSLPASVRGSPQCTTSTARSGAIGTGSIASDRQSMRSACPARPNSAASWSIRPPGTPVASTSAASASRAASTPSSGSPPRSASGERERHRRARSSTTDRPDRYRRRNVELGAGRSMRPACASTRAAAGDERCPTPGRRRGGRRARSPPRRRHRASSRSGPGSPRAAAGAASIDALAVDRHRKARSRRCSRCGRPSGSRALAPGSGSPGEGCGGRAGSDFNRGPRSSILVA